MFSLVGLALLSFAASSFVGRRFIRDWVKRLFYFWVLAVFLYDLFLTFQFYKTWESHVIARFFLPQYQSSYFYEKSLITIFLPHIIALVAALVWIFILDKLNEKKGGVFFEKEEPYLAGFSIFLVGHPGWLIYLVLLITFYTALHLTSFLKEKKRTNRIPLYVLWPTFGFITASLKIVWLSETQFWKLLEI